jgi:hypothetical protein
MYWDITDNKVYIISGQAIEVIYFVKYLEIYYTTS